jgi:hypothetical protein
MVFECSFNNLMENIGWQELMDVCSWKSIGEWLQIMMNKHFRKVCKIYHDAVYNTIIIPHLLCSKSIKQGTSVVMISTATFPVKIFRIGSTAVRDSAAAFWKRLMITVDTSLGQYMRAGLAQDSPQYMVQAHKLCADNGHPHNGQSRGFPYKGETIPVYAEVMHGTAGGGTAW